MDRGVELAGESMAAAVFSVAPCAPVFVVEVIDEEGFAWLYGPVHLHEALKLAAMFERAAKPGKEPRIVVPPSLIRAGLTDE